MRLVNIKSCKNKKNYLLQQGELKWHRELHRIPVLKHAHPFVLHWFFAAL